MSKSTSQTTNPLDVRVKFARAGMKILLTQGEEDGAVKVASAKTASVTEKVMSRYTKQLDTKIQKIAAARELICKA